MPSVNRVPKFQQRYSIRELIELRRTMLLYARSCPPGAERNEHRQVALSLRSLFQNNNWVNSHTWEGIALITADPRSPLRVRNAMTNLGTTFRALHNEQP